MAVLSGLTFAAPPGAPVLPAAHALALQADFVCQKQLPLLDMALVSQGTLTVEAPDHVHLSTTVPYQSDIILIGGKVIAKSQHEAAWTQSPFPTRPGLTALMTHIAAAALGNAKGGGGGKSLTDLYTISGLSDAVPPPPSPPSAPSTPSLEHAEVSIQDSEMFLLTATDKDLQKSVKELRLAFDAHTHLLIFAKITTRQDDVVRYWFTNIRLNPALGPATFAPAAAH